MKRILIAITLLLSTQNVYAEIIIPATPKRVISDSANVINDRGSMLEIFPTQRLTSMTNPATGKTMRGLAATKPNAPIGPKQLGVVYNYAMQQQGYVSGEIAFLLKSGAATSSFPTTQYPELKKITKNGVYTVKASTPAQFVELTQRLKANPVVQWVEPIVNYTSGPL